MKFVVFGLTISSSWGNGHATLWRGLARALSRRGHQLVFFERDQPYYARTRDLWELPGLTLVLYSDSGQLRRRAPTELAGAEVGLVTSFCPDGPLASELLLSSRAQVRGFYDLDTPVTLSALERGRAVEYLPQAGLGDFDLVLSYTGGRALELLRTRLGACRVLPLYGSVDPELHRPVPARQEFRGALSYLGTYAADRQATLGELLLRPAELRQQRQFVIAGAQYPADFPWRPNLYFVRHLPPGDHSAFFASSPITLNVTRAPMKALGYCPSPRFFEAAACGVPTISDVWEGIERFLQPGSEVLLARDHQDVLVALDAGRSELSRIGRRAQERVFAEHTAAQRVKQLERALFDSNPVEEAVPRC